MNSVTAFPVIKYRYFSCATSLLASCATLPQPGGHHLTRQSNSRGTRSVVLTAGRRGSQDCGTSRCSATCSWHPAEHQWSRSNPRTQAEGLYSFPYRDPPACLQLVSHTLLSAVINSANSQRALENWSDDNFSSVATACLLG